MTQSQTVFITGVGGFIGLRLAQRCQALGMHVRGVDSAPAAVERARQLGIDAVLGDITDAATLRAPLAHAQVVVHTAAIVKEHGELSEFRRVNVAGSRTVALAAREAGVRSFVQLSSVMVYGFDFPANVTEDGPLRGDGNPYCQTKIESERAVLELNDPPSFGVIVIRPGDVYGPGSQPWIARPIEMLRKRRLLLPMGGRGMINHVYVDNLVDGILAALEASAYGEAFNITDGQPSTFADFFGRLASAASLPAPRVVPTSVMRVLVRIAAALSARGLMTDDASPDTVRYLCRPHAYSIDKARKVLGYAPRIDLAAGLALTQPYIESLTR